MASEEQQIAREIVVFFTPEGDPFSNDPRWNDSRVQDAWHAQQGDEAEVTEDDEDEELPPYSEWTNENLRAELVERKLSLDGKKADMVARLEEDDAKAQA